MLDDQDPATAHMADLSYAIASARAVVMALIERDRDAAEEAALRTCRDCDLLIRFIRDLAAVLQTSDLNQLPCSQAELRWLARHAAYVLTFVGAQVPGERPPCSPSAQGDTGSTPDLQEQAPARPQQYARVPTRSASTSLTVAATGLRVRLVPIDGSKAAASSHDDRDNNQHGSEAAAHPKPIER